MLLSQLDSRQCRVMRLHNKKHEYLQAMVAGSGAQSQDGEKSDCSEQVNAAAHVTNEDSGMVTDEVNERITGKSQNMVEM